MKRAITTALDKHDREREMTAVLLSALYNEVRARRPALCCAPRAALHRAAAALPAWAPVLWMWPRLII